MSEVGQGPDTAARPHSSIFVSFGPWIAVWVLTSNHSFIPGMLVATGLAIGLIVWTFASGQRPKFLDWATLVVMAAFTVVAVVGDEDWLGYWLAPMLNAALFLVMAVSLAVGHPFTTDYAKEEAPPEVWDTPEFRHINVVITGVWTAAAAAMTIGAGVSALLTSGDVVTSVSQAKTIEAVASWGVTIVALVVAMKFTSWYPDAYGRKLSGATQAAGAA